MFSSLCTILPNQLKLTFLLNMATSTFQKVSEQVKSTSSGIYHKLPEPLKCVFLVDMVSTMINKLKSVYQSKVMPKLACLIAYFNVHFSRFPCNKTFVRRGLLVSLGMLVFACYLLSSAIHVIRPRHHYIRHKSYERFLLSVYPGNQECIPPGQDEFIDLPRHPVYRELFSCQDDKDEGQPLMDTRKQIYIECSEDGFKTEAVVEEVEYFDDVQSFKTLKEKLCLQRYIKQNCYDGRPVPDVIHLLWYGKNFLEMRQMLSLYSILTIAKPCLVVLHTNSTPSGDLWDMLRPAAWNVVRAYKKPQEEINGRSIKSVTNQADIGRLEILLEYGGIFLDSDVILIRKLDIFREAHFAAGKAGSSSNLANGILIAEPRNTIMSEWLTLWQNYDGHSWNAHSTHMLTKLAKKYSNKVTALGPVFIKFGLRDTYQLYNASCSLGDSYAAHLYKHDFPSDQDIRTARTTFARLARFVLFGDPEACTTHVRKREVVHQEHRPPPPPVPQKPKDLRSKLSDTFNKYIKVW